MQLPANLQALLRNKYALAGVGAAAGAGAWALYRRGQGDEPKPSTEDTAVGSGSVTFPDSGMTDLATALGDIDSRYAEQVGIFRSQLTADHAALLAMQKQLQKPPPAPAKPAPKPAPRPVAKKPAPRPAPKPTYRTVTVKKGNTLSGIAKSNRLSLSTLRKLNPTLFDRRHRGGNLIHPGEKVRIT